MKHLLPKLLLLGLGAAGLGVAGLVVYELTFHFKERSTYLWTLELTSPQTARVVCGRATFYYLGFQNPDNSIPVFSRMDEATPSKCGSKEVLRKQFPALYAPKQQCQQTGELTWRCEGDFLPAVYERQQRLKQG